jgi:hypothetical protein
MQAIAAATFEGKPVDVDFGPGSGPATGGDGGGTGSSGGGIGCWSGIPYIHKMAVALSSNSATGQIRPEANLRRDTSLFCFHSVVKSNIVAFLTDNL